MGNRIIRTASLFSIMAVTLLVLGTSCGKPAAESAGGVPGSVFLNPKSQSAKPGNQIKMSLEVVPADWGVSAFEVQISFDPAKLEALSVEAGDALGAKPILGIRKIDNAQGTIVYALARVGDTTAPGKKGVLANLVFSGKSGAAGPAKLELTKVGLTDENF